MNSVVGLVSVQHEADNAPRIQALREAIQVGVDDIGAGRFKTLESPESLKVHSNTLATRAIFTIYIPDRLGHG